MEEVDRDATTKELENIEETVDRECVTVESAIGIICPLGFPFTF